jgi:hypothetical protein
MKTPVLKFGDQDPLSSLVYTGDMYKKAAEDMKAALGIKRTITDDGTPIDESGIQTKYTKYDVFSNTPIQVRDYYLAKMADRDANKHYTWELKNIPEDELVKTNEQFQSIPDSQWQLMGIKKPDLSYSRLDDNAHVLATYKAQKAALENLPKQSGFEIRTNAKAKADYDYKNKLKAMGYNDALMRGRMKKAQEYRENFIKFRQAKTEAEQQGIVTKFIENQKRQSPKEYEFLKLRGEKFGSGKFVEPTVSIANKFATYEGKDKSGNDMWSIPDAFYITDDNKDVVPVKFRRDILGKPVVNSNGEIVIENTGFNRIPMQNYRVEIAKELISKKNLGEGVIDEFVGDKDPKYETYLSNIEKGEFGNKTFNVINPNTGQIVMEGVDEETAKKAAAKGYKYQ